MKRLLLAALMLSGSALSSHAADCGKVTIADMNWNSATLIANVEKVMLEYGFGCEAELVPGDTMPTGASMTEKGEPDIAPEFWSNSMREVIDKGVAEGRLAIAGKSLSDGGEEGFWVPAYMVEKEPSLATIEGVIKNAKLFPHPEDGSKSGFYGCPAGWNCQISTGNLFKALKLEDAGFEIVDPGSGAGLSGSIAKAYERGEGWFGYYWAPTAVLGKYKMVKVDSALASTKRNSRAAPHRMTVQIPSRPCIRRPWFRPSPRVNSPKRIPKSWNSSANSPSPTTR